VQLTLIGWPSHLGPTFIHANPDKSNGELTRVDPLLGSYTSDVSGDETHIGSDVLVVRARRDIQPHEEISVS
jgi:hypothetical protein